MANDKATWQTTAERKREDRADRLKPYSNWSLGDLTPSPSQKNVIPLVHARLTDRERSFLAADVTDLAHRLATKECTAVEVTTAFCKATYAAQELTNCVTEVMFTQALNRARELDEHLEKTGKVVGSLHGVPISIKDHISIKGEDAACGYTAWIGRNVAEEDAPIVHILRAAGAVIYVKTTIPQAIYALETSSNIYGLTTNPYNRDLSSGGSSGGEAALIASRASLLGVGTDIGGSIRCVEALDSQLVPAAYCKLYALKTSGYRLPSSGIIMPYKGQEDIPLAIGPMAHSIRDLELFCRVISEYQPWNLDFSTLHMPWNQSLAQSAGEKLVVGLLMDDGIVAPHPPIVECLQKAREALVAAGHEVIDWTPIDAMPALELLVRMYAQDGGEIFRAPLVEAGEPAIPLIEQFLNAVQKATGSTLADSWATNVKRDQLRARVLKHWNETASRSKSGRPVDVILCPAAATLAPPHGTTIWAGYTNYWNLLDLPTASFPVGEAFDAARWKAGSNLPPGKPRSPVEELVTSQWDPEKYDGSPIGLQLVGRRWQEEKLIAHLKIVDALVNPSK